MFGREGNAIDGAIHETGDSSSEGMNKEARELEDSKAAKLA